MKNLLVPAFASVAALLGGCSTTVMALNPHPTTPIAGDTGVYTVVTSAVADDYEPGGKLHIHQFKQTLANGLQAAVGTRYSSKADPNATRLVFSELAFSYAKTNEANDTLDLRFRASWQAPDGRVITEVSGNAHPINASGEGRKRSVESTVEAMYGQIIAGLAQAQPPMAAAQ